MSFDETDISAAIVLSYHEKLLDRLVSDIWRGPLPGMGQFVGRRQFRQAFTRLGGNYG